MSLHFLASTLDNLGVRYLVTEVWHTRVISIPTANNDNARFMPCKALHSSCKNHASSLPCNIPIRSHFWGMTYKIWIKGRWKDSNFYLTHFHKKSLFLINSICLKVCFIPPFVLSICVLSGVWFVQFGLSLTVFYVM